MRILLKLVIDCDADAAWRAVHSPRAVSELYGPLLDMAPLEPGGLPATFEPGADLGFQLSLAGAVPLGRQRIHVSDRFTQDRAGAVRIFRDSGSPMTGILSTLDVWDHQMAISEAPGDPTKTLWRDRLVIRGALAPALWPVLWTMWQWRGARIAALAHTWAYDPPPAEPEDTAPTHLDEPNRADDSTTSDEPRPANDSREFDI